MCHHSNAICRYKRFAAVYLLAGLSGSVASYVLSDLTTVGASGALFGLLGALVAYFAKNPKLERAGQQIFYILGILGFNVLLGMDEGGMVDNTGHFAGFAAGLWLGAFLAPRWQVRRCRCGQHAADDTNYHVCVVCVAKCSKLMAGKCWLSTAQCTQPSHRNITCRLEC